MAGLDQASVNKFKSMGFAEDQIVSSIDRLRTSPRWMRVGSNNVCFQ